MIGLWEEGTINRFLPGARCALCKHSKASPVLVFLLNYYISRLIVSGRTFSMGELAPKYKL